MHYNNLSAPLLKMVKFERKEKILLLFYENNIVDILGKFFENNSIGLKN